MNLLLTAIFLIISARFESLSGFFLGAAIQNVFLALLNLTLVDGFDGMAIMGELLGVENVISKARRITRFKFKRKNLKKTVYQVRLLLRFVIYSEVFRLLYR